MPKLIPCTLCDKIATYTIQSEHASKPTYYCTKHFNATLKELQS